MKESHFEAGVIYQGAFTLLGEVILEITLLGTFNFFGTGTYLGAVKYLDGVSRWVR